MRRFAPGLVALLAPVLLVGGTLAVLARPAPPADVELPADVAALGAKVANGADVVVLGNSKVGSDLDLPALARAVGIDPARVVALNLDGTNAPIWYAVLKRRVYDQGHTPEVVVVYCTLAMMVQVDLLSESLNAQLARHLGTPDPAIDHKVFGHEKVNPTWKRVLTRRTEAHTALLDGLRDGLVGLAFAPSGEGDLRARGAAVAHPALGRVFGTDAMTAGERVRAVPVVEQEVTTTGDAGQRDVDATLIPDLIELARSHGSEIVFVRSPMGSLKHGHDVVPRSLEESVIGRMAQLGAAWVDLSKAGPLDSGYGDGSHMNRTGRDFFMPRVIASLKAVGVGTGGPLVPASITPSRPLPSVTRTGHPRPIVMDTPIRGRLACDYHIQLPTLRGLADNVLTDAHFGEISPLRVYEDGLRLSPHAEPSAVNDRCTGSTSHWNGTLKFSPTSSPEGADAGLKRTYQVLYDDSVPLVGGRGEEAWWVYPGTTLRFDFTADAMHDALAAAVSALPVVPGVGTPTLRLGDAPAAPLTQSGINLIGAGRFGGDGSSSLLVTSPEDGPVLLLERLAIATTDSPWYVIGTPPRVAMIDLLASPVRYAAPPRALSGPTAPPIEAHWRKDTWVFPVAALGVPSMEESALLGAACSALRLSVDGIPAETQVDGAPPDTPLAQVTHSNDRLLVRFHGNPASPGPANRFGYSVDPDRRCGEHARWVSPGDQALLSLAPDALAPLRTAATALRLMGGAFTATDADVVQVQVTVTSAAGNPELFMDRTVPLARFTQGEIELLFDRPIPREAAVDVRVGSTGWLLLTYAGLAEAAPDLFAAAD